MILHSCYLICRLEGINNTATDNAWDYSGYGYNGIEMGATWTGTGGYGGRGAYAFDGSNDVVAADLPLIVSASDPITIAAWIKPNTIAGTQTIISKGAAANCFSYGMMIYAGGELRARNHANDHVLATTVVANDWNFLVISFNSTGAYGYVNGTFVGSNSAATTTLCALTNLTIGATATGNANPFNGNIDEVMVWNRSLTGQQIHALFNNRTDLIVAQETTKGENWTVIGYPNNGTGDGARVRSNTVKILSIPPTHSTPILNTTNLGSNRTEVNLTAYNVSTADIDNDIVKNIYNWQVNGIPIAVLNMPFEGINGTATNNAWDYSGRGSTGTETGAYLGMLLAVMMGKVLISIEKEPHKEEF